MADAQALFSNIYNGIVRKNGNLLSKLLTLNVEKNIAPHPLLVQKLRSIDLVSHCTQQFSDPNIATLVSSVLQSLVFVGEKNFEAAYKSHLVAYNAVLDFFSSREENTNWIIPALIRVSNDLRLVAARADDAANDMNFKCLRESLNSLTRGFTIVAKDRTPLKQPGAKKLAIFAVTNVLFKIYFKVNTLQLCGKLISVVEGPGNFMENLSLFPVCDVVMYKYYIGRLKMFEDRYEESRDCLRFALNHTPANQIKNRQRILASLVPIEMCLGVMPGAAIGKVYGLLEFVELGDAVKKGDLQNFERIMNQYQCTFIQHGVYLVLEHVKMIVYRNLFRKVFLLTNTTRLNIQLLEGALNWLGETTDLDEIECILTNLIYQNRVKGYISHEKRFLIVSKNDPFPISAIVKKHIS